MKITDHTDDMLIIDDKPWVGGLVVGMFGMLFAVLGILRLIAGETTGVLMILVSGGMFYVLYKFIERLQVVFNRPDGTVEFRKKSMQRYHLESYPLADIDKAHVSEKLNEQTSSSRKGGAYKTSQLILIRKNKADPLPLLGGHRSGSQYQGIAKAINDWLAQ